jgi:NADPH2:quinone reductase
LLHEEALGLGSLRLLHVTATQPADKRSDLLTMAQDLFNVVLSGAVKIEVNRTYPLQDAASAHQALQARKTIGLMILTG